MKNGKVKVQFFIVEKMCETGASLCSLMIHIIARGPAFSQRRYTKWFRP